MSTRRHFSSALFAGDLVARHQNNPCAGEISPPIREYSARLLACSAARYSFVGLRLTLRSFFLLERLIITLINLFGLWTRLFDRGCGAASP